MHIYCIISVENLFNNPFILPFLSLVIDICVPSVVQSIVPLLDTPTNVAKLDVIFLLFCFFFHHLYLDFYRKLLYFPHNKAMKKKINSNNKNPKHKIKQKRNVSAL